jgi:phenylpropionate dioxygenase-like ring-hydroxylating dioxygenase large terminal subunit
LQCAYHGWRFGSDGRCVHIPALGPGAAVPPTARLAGVSVREAFGLVWIAPESPRAPLLDVAEWDEPALRRAWLPAVDIATSAGQFLDNFCDFGHFPFVHAGTFGVGEDELVGDFTIERVPHGYRLDYTHVAANVEDPLVATGAHPLLQPRSMTYTYRVPFAAVLRIEYPMSKTVNAIATWAQPVDASTTRVYTCMLRNDIADDRAAGEAVHYELGVLAEDIAILERLAVHGLDLDMRAQVHTRADRCTLELRRCLAEAITEEAT